MTIEFIGPLTVAVVGSRRLLDVVWVALAGGGVALLALARRSPGRHALGVVLALVAGACWAFYILLSKRVGAAFAALDGLAIALGVGTLLVLPAGHRRRGHGARAGQSCSPAGLAVALLSSLIPYSLEIVALRRLSAAAFGLLMSLEPAVAALAGVVVLGQALTAVLLVALVMVVAASVGTTVTARRVEPRPPEV